MARKRRTVDPQHDDERYPIANTGWFDKSLDGLRPPPLREQVLARLGEFKRDWLAGMGVGDLYDNYDFKPVNNGAACASRKLHQIKPTSDTRIHLCLVPPAKKVYLIQVFKKTSVGVQDQAIDLSCSRARAI